MRQRQIDLAKIDYLISNNTLNQLTQHYFSSQLPELAQVIFFHFNQLMSGIFQIEI